SLAILFLCFLSAFHYSLVAILYRRFLADAHSFLVGLPSPYYPAYSLFFLATILYYCFDLFALIPVPFFLFVLYAMASHLFSLLHT
ncbi:hypothetical protein, partial [Bacillus paranthracis]|uniref:hypothetical protein n=1 Tax=Bacillus paranthracis TaxID=2026186 RepID=UPI0028526E39